MKFDLNNIGLRISSFFGLAYIFVFIWFRFIRERLPRDIFHDNSKFSLVVYCFFFTMSIIIVLFYTIKILKIERQSMILTHIAKSPMVQKVAYVITDIILRGPINFYEFLYKRIKIRPFIDYIAKKTTLAELNEKPLLRYNLLILKYISRLIIIIIFLNDIFINQQFNMFYKSLLLLMVPISIEVTLFIIYNLVRKNKSIIEEWITFPVKSTNDGFDMRLNVENKKNPLLQIRDEDTLLTIMQRHYDTWYFYLYTSMTIDNYYNLDEKYKNWVNLIIYIGYSVGWGYILFHIFLTRIY